MSDLERNLNREITKAIERYDRAERDANDDTLPVLTQQAAGYLSAYEEGYRDGLDLAYQMIQAVVDFDENRRLSAENERLMAENARLTARYGGLEAIGG